MSTNDYRVFVANLRAAGCPAQTVEDIVRGDASRAFGAMHRQLGIDGTTPGPWSAQSQMQMVAYLLGQASSPVPEVAAAATPPSRTRPRPSPEDRPVSMPLILVDVDLKGLGLNDEQMQSVANVRQEFMQQIGGTTRIPKTRLIWPAGSGPKRRRMACYRPRWDIMFTPNFKRAPVKRSWNNNMPRSRDGVRAKPSQPEIRK